ncbi:hypothetical protein CVT26_012889 [Gymnopilus dilepis]|uniref:Uncharacterized protein n=1 Tax=Gymnopilus dilepis TaxID=231916 RepID=A0A409YNY0_9AGAR|nr:hypothetical protein CVT26_012889 [Gymnopilus dilepis]
MEKPAIQPLVPKARGLSGSRSASFSVSTDFSDFSSILNACAAPLFKSLATAAMSSLTPPRPSLHNAERLSSPPPAVEGELAACMKAFRAA